jgi:hypothetical protein
VQSSNTNKTVSKTPVSQSLIQTILLLCIVLSATILAAPAFADAPAFDLQGPTVEMTVTRDGKKLPISNVSDLRPGDKLWIHPVFPRDQAVHYLLIVAFLKGPTNPPPDNWFTRVETWNKQVREEGTSVVVPAQAEGALMFLAPETGGDFSTLRNAVVGRPGVFIRASKDLEQASLDRTRLDKYLEEIRKTSDQNPADLKKNSELLAQTLRIKVNEDCFNRPLEQQAACLTANTGGLVIDDAHSQSVVAMLTSGPSSDLISALGQSPAARGGYYSPYVGAVVDVARLMSSLHTAPYQYIPALSLPDKDEKDEMDLRLNSPPSFHTPKSVLVVGLPGIGQAPLPPLRPVDPKEGFCLQKSPLIVPVEGAPLVFSTAIAHDFVFRVQPKTGPAIDLPAQADAARGGFVVDTHNLHGTNLGDKLTGTLQGYWGFSAFEGPQFQFRQAHATDWKISAGDGDTLVAGKDSTVQLQSECAPCVEKMTLEDSTGKDLKPTWKAASADELEVAVPLKGEQAGQLKLRVEQFGIATPETVMLRAYQEAVHLDHFIIYPHDGDGILTGTALNEVASLETGGVQFIPEKSPGLGQGNSLDLTAQNVSAVAALRANDMLPARVTLTDGRVFDLHASVGPSRPKVTLVSKNVQQSGQPSQIHFGNTDDLPQDGKLAFFLKSEVPDKFPRTEKIEVATADGMADAMLSIADGTLIPQDESSVLAVLDPVKAFGPGAFGALRFRPIDADGDKGKWQPIGVLVRIPALTEVHCPDAPDKPCTLSGSNLFLVASVASDALFTNAVQVPAGYVDNTLIVPRPNGTLLYVKLRDDLNTVDMVALPVLPDAR